MSILGHSAMQWATEPYRLVILDFTPLMLTLRKSFWCLKKFRNFSDILNCILIKGVHTGINSFEFKCLTSIINIIEHVCTTKQRWIYTNKKLAE